MASLVKHHDGTHRSRDGRFVAHYQGQRGGGRRWVLYDLHDRTGRGVYRERTLRDVEEEIRNLRREAR